MQLVGSVMRVFSAHAEVVPDVSGYGEFNKGILRARGGSSTAHAHLPSPLEYSPRTRR